jgi:DNA-binding response OmpR family regulator
MSQRILIIEDDQFIVEAITDLLELKHYEVYTANNGLVGLNKLPQTRPDLIILDLMMPVMDGLQFMEQLRKNASYKHLPVIMLTAKHTQENKIEGLEYGADYYITKPFDHKELLLVIENILSRRDQVIEKTLHQPEQIFAESKDNQFLANLHDLVMANIRNEDLDLQEIANRLSYSPSSIQKKIKRLTNKSVSQYVREFRLEYAKQLIEQDAASIKEIAFRSGFHSHAYFTRCFREYFGTTPTKLTGKNEDS